MKKKLTIGAILVAAISIIAGFQTCGLACVKISDIAILVRGIEAAVDEDVTPVNEAGAGQ